MEWYRNLRIVLTVEDKLPFLEQPIPAMPVPPAGQVLPSDVLNTHTAWVKASKEIVGLMLMTMDPYIQKNLEQLLHEQTFLPKEATPALHAIRAGRIHKNQKKKSHNAAKDNQGKGKAKMGYAPVLAPPFAPKPKNLPIPKKDNPTKDAICHQCGKGLRESRKLKPGALSMYVGDGHRAAVYAIGEFTQLNNLIYFNVIPLDDIYEIDLSSSNTNDSSMYAVSNKRAKLNLDSTLLWHCHLGHINKKRLEKLQHDGLLDSTDIKSFEKCVSCCEALVKRDTLTKPDKLEPRSIKCIFVGYPKETMGYSFYYPLENKVFVARNAEFLENSLITQEASGSLKDLEIIQEDTHPSINNSLHHEEDDQEIDEPQSDINPIRRFTRISFPTNRLCLHVDAEEHELGDLVEPANYKAALLDPESDNGLML
ncbi:zinc finger, CCHC-type containing protein [Tanacetum coccineum]